MNPLLENIAVIDISHKKLWNTSLVFSLSFFQHLRKILLHLTRWNVKYAIRYHNKVIYSIPLCESFIYLHSTSWKILVEGKLLISLDFPSSFPPKTVRIWKLVFRSSGPLITRGHFHSVFQEIHKIRNDASIWSWKIFCVLVERFSNSTSMSFLTPPSKGKSLRTSSWTRCSLIL